MNKGIRVAKGDYIALLNAGDFYDRDTCQIIVDEIKKDNAKSDIYYGIMRFLNQKGELDSILEYTIDAFPKSYDKSSFMYYKQICVYSDLFIIQLFVLLQIMILLGALKIKGVLSILLKRFF